jgi:hypothetical protein
MRRLMDWLVRRAPVFVLIVSFSQSSLIIYAQTAAAHAMWSNGQTVDPTTKLLCCGPNDCHQIEMDRVTATDAGYFVRLTGLGWYPSFMGTDPVEIANNRLQPSPDGHYWVCFWSLEVQCFFGPLIY